MILINSVIIIINYGLRNGHKKDINIDIIDPTPILSSLLPS